jgi:hypothetical protein
MFRMISASDAAGFADFIALHHSGRQSLRILDWAAFWELSFD